MADVFGSIIGQVHDPEGFPLPGATVTARGTGSSERVTVTDAGGRFRFPDTPPGAYTVIAELEGFTTSRRQVTVPIDRTVDMEITLQIAQVVG